MPSKIHRIASTISPRAPMYNARNKTRKTARERLNPRAGLWLQNKPPERLPERRGCEPVAQHD